MWLQKPPLGTPIRFDHPLAKGLLGCWLFNENGGDKAYDLSGNGNHGTLTGMSFPPTATSGWNPGKFGPALAFVTNDYVNAGSKEILNLTSAMALEIWVKSNSISTRQGLVERANGADYPTVQYLLELNTSKVRFAFDSNLKVLSSTTTLLSNTLYHIVAVYNGNTMEIYLNGKLDGTLGGIAPPGSETQPLLIGIQNEGGSYTYFPLNGMIDLIRLYNRPMFAQEIQQLYYEPFGMFQERKVYYFVQAVGLSIPVAMHHYKLMRR